MAAVAVAVFVVTFVTAVLGLRELLRPFDTRSRLEATIVRRDVLEARAGAIDTVIVGTSRTMHAIDPRVLAEEAGAAGLPIRPFNVANSALNLLEAYEIIGALALFEQPGIEVVLLEPAVDLPILYYPPTDRRNTDFYDRRRAGVAFSLFRTQPMPSTRQTLGAKYPRALQVWNLFESLVYHETGTGVLARALLPPVPLQPSFAEALGVDEAGYTALERLDRPDIHERRRKHLGEPEAFAAQVAWRTAVFHGEAGRDVPLSPVVRGMLLDLAARAKAAGVKLVLVAPPAAFPLMAELPVQQAIARGEIDLPMLDYTDPARYPQFYRHEAHFDYGHLTREAAVEFSRLLARDLARLVRESR